MANSPMTKNACKCVFCFHRLQPRDVCFESINESENLTEDEVKWNFKRTLDYGINPFSEEAMSRKPIVRFGEAPDSEFIVDGETGFPLFWKEPIGDGDFKMTNGNRICAFCHMPLPTKFGKCPNIMIGFCGNSNAGKTVYMLSLLHDLAQVDRMSVNWDAALSPDREIVKDSVNYKTAYEVMYQGCRDMYVLPSATDPGRVLPPLVLDCMYKNREFMITAYDMAGEGMKEPFYMARIGQYLQHCHGVVYLKDPEYLPGFARAGSRLNEHEYLNVVFDQISAGDANRDGQRAHVAITMTKIDMLLDRYEDDEDFRRIVGTMFDSEDVAIHWKGFNVNKALLYNNHMKDLYGWGNTADGTIITAYMRQRGRRQEAQAKKPGFFKRLFGGGSAADESEENIMQRAMLFGVSPLGRGTNPHKTDDADLGTLTVLDHPPHGLHNADPVLWILYCCGIFPAVASDAIGD